VILNVKNLTNHRYDIAANEAVAYVGEPLAAYLTVRYKTRRFDTSRTTTLTSVDLKLPLQPCRQ
jgi:hypothetical protein